MQIFIIPIGFALWYVAYAAKPLHNDKATSIWEEENLSKRTKLFNILKNSF